MKTTGMSDARKWARSADAGEGGGVMPTRTVEELAYYVSYKIQGVSQTVKVFRSKNEAVKFARAMAAEYEQSAQVSRGELNDFGVPRTVEGVDRDGTWAMIREWREVP